MIVKMVTLNVIFVPYENSFENCISEWRTWNFHAENMFDNEWYIHGKINEGFHMKKRDQAWLAVDLGKTYFLQMHIFKEDLMINLFIGLLV